MIDSTSLWVILAITLVVYAIKKCRRDPRHVKFAKTLPGPPEWPIIGNSMDFLERDMLKLMTKYKEKYGDTYRLWLGKYLAITLSNVEELQTVFMNSKMLAKPKLFKPFHDFIGDTIFTTMSVSKWRKSRKIIQPSFGRGTLSSYTTIINKKADVLVDTMKNMNLVDGPEFDACDYLSNLMADILIKLVFNIDLSWDDELLQSLVQHYIAGDSGFEVCYKKICIPWLQYSVIDYLFYRKQAQRYRKDTREFLQKLVESKNCEILQQIEAHKNKSDSSEAVPPKTVLTLAYELAQMENDENIMFDDLLTLLLAGSDPIIRMAYFLQAIAIHQDIQNKLYDELFEVFGDSDRPADENDLNRLPYLDQVLRETLRRFPVIPFLFREAEEDVKIGDRIIPAGTVVMVSIAAVNFNPEWYPDPWKFNPDNFSPEVASKRHKLTCLTFSAGVRNCPGMNFAMFEMKLTFVALLRNFAFYTTMKMEDIHESEGFVISPVNGFKLSVSSRIRKPTNQSQQKIE